MCCHVSWVKVTWVPACAALIPAMQDSMTDDLPFSRPIKTPQTSVLLQERACWRICRTTSLSMTTVGGATSDLNLCFVIAPPPTLATQGPRPCLRRSSKQVPVREFAQQTHRTVAAPICRAYARRIPHSRQIHER